MSRLSSSRAVERSVSAGARALGICTSLGRENRRPSRLGGGDSGPRRTEDALAHARAVTAGATQASPLRSRPARRVRGMLTLVVDRLSSLVHGRQAATVLETESQFGQAWHAAPLQVHV